MDFWNLKMLKKTVDLSLFINKNREIILLFALATL